MNSKLKKVEKIKLEEIIACPKCKTNLKPKNGSGKCPICAFTYSKKNGIWHFLNILGSRSKNSQKEYDKVHDKHFVGPEDGSYDILASIARGSRTVDIACGQGQIEKLAPDTVGVEFSLNALIKARKAGVKNLVLADAHSLPFRNNSFDVSISSGNLEHFANPQKAISEMARISKIQVIIVHTHPPIPLAHLIHNLITTFLKIKHQPIERPISKQNLFKMLKKSKLHIVYSGYWNLPINFGRVIKFLPEFNNFPSCNFVISIKK